MRSEAMWAALGLAILGPACLTVPAAADDGSSGSTSTTTSSGSTSVSTSGPTNSSGSTESTSSTGISTDTGQTSSGSMSTASGSTGGTTGSPLDDDPDLLAWYTFDDDFDEGRADDATGHEFHAFCDAAIGACPEYEPGVMGLAVHLDGVDDHFRVEMPAAEVASQAWTVAVWIKRDAADPENLRMPLGKAFGTGSRNTYEFYYHDWSGMNGPILLHAGSTVASADDWVNDPTLHPVGAWIHAAAVFDGASLTLWVDGNEVGSVTVGDMEFDDHDLVIGGDENGDGPVSDFFNGSVDDVRVYTRVLVASEIQELHDMGAR